MQDFSLHQLMTWSPPKPYPALTCKCQEKMKILWKVDRTGPPWHLGVNLKIHVKPRWVSWCRTSEQIITLHFCSLDWRNSQRWQMWSEGPKIMCILLIHSKLCCPKKSDTGFLRYQVQEWSPWCLRWNNLQYWWDKCSQLLIGTF
jgi:hypothetical protein